MELKKLYNSEDPDTPDKRKEILEQIEDGYHDYCREAGLDPDEDNRMKKPGYFYRGSVARQLYIANGGAEFERKLEKLEKLHD